MTLSDDSDLYRSVLVDCIGDTGYQSLPLHKVCLKSKYVPGDDSWYCGQNTYWGCTHASWEWHCRLTGKHVSCAVWKTYGWWNLYIVSLWVSVISWVVVITAMVKKAERESHSNVTNPQGDTDVDMTFIETMYSAWCEPLFVKTVLLHRMCYQNWSKVLTWNCLEMSGKGSLRLRNLTQISLNCIKRDCQLRRETRYLCVTL